MRNGSQYSLHNISCHTIHFDSLILQKSLPFCWCSRTAGSIQDAQQLLSYMCIDCSRKGYLHRKSIIPSDSIIEQTILMQNTKKIDPAVPVRTAGLTFGRVQPITVILMNSSLNSSRIIAITIAKLYITFAFEFMKLFDQLHLHTAQHLDGRCCKASSSSFGDNPS